MSCMTLCNPINCSMPGILVLHYPLEFGQTHVHLINDTIQPPHPLDFNFSQHQGLLNESALRSSVKFSCSVMSDSLWPHGLQHARNPCPSSTYGVSSNVCPLSRWHHPTISSCVVPFSSCLQSFPASGSFQMSQIFALGGQSIGVSASASVLPMNIQDWFPLGLIGRISLKAKGCSSLLQHHSSKASILQPSAFFRVQLSHPYMTTRKTITLTGRTFVGKVMSLLFNMVSRLVIIFLPKCSLVISNFLEISSLSHSVVFLYFFALIAEEGFLISSC